jgi:hypothetical protein
MFAVDSPMAGNQYNCSNISIKDSEFIAARLFAIIIKHCDGVVVSRNRLAFVTQDGIGVWDSPNVTITGNTLSNVNDNSISVHANDTDPAPARSGIVISNNNITESSHIAVLGAKSAAITGNVMRRMLGGCLQVEAAPSASAGDTPLVGIEIGGNVCTDAFKRDDTNTYFSGQFYFLLNGGPKGAPNPEPLLPTFGTAGTSGALYAIPTNAIATTPGGAFWNVHNNTLARTLPAQTTAYTDWGYNSSGLWQCTIPGGVVTCGYSTAKIIESHLNTPGIQIDGAMRSALFADNIISTTGIPIWFSAIIPQNGDVDRVVFRGNQLSDWCGATGAACSQAGIFWSTGSPVYERIEIADNSFDADPRFVASNHNADGTWSSTAAPYGINLNGNVTGVSIIHNSFRNLTNLIQGVATIGPFLEGNVVYANPVAVDDSASNGGVRIIPRPGAAWTVVHEDSDSTSATYGKMLSNSTKSASAMPATGTWVQGTFVQNDHPTDKTLGWLRLTTSANNILNTDWVAIIGTP